ncbi:MAG: histidine kinase [Clostridia bacterium]|jgi:signal transduction histidine kinase|nr:histidine kinase [Clostridia bacterium]
MKKGKLFKSIYAKFVIIFLMIWWLLNSLTFGFIAHIMSSSFLAKFSAVRLELFDEFYRVRKVTGLIFLISIIIGTVIIIFAVRGIIKPIKRLSNASKEVAKGNFDIEVRVTSRDEIGQLTSDFNLMTKELKTIDHLRKDFVSNVSHEFKTPITSIKGFASLIKNGKLSNEQLLEYSEIIINESERLALLSANLLKLSELDNKFIKEHASTFSLDEQIRQTILILETHWTNKNLDFDIELEEASFYGDMQQFQQVWLNLIQNAIKFSKQNGKIKISLYKKEGFIKVEIADDGIGIADEDKPHIFERFYKGDKSRSKDGNGLGLAIVKKIIELYNGKVYFESESGKGTIFTVELPENL